MNNLPKHHGVGPQEAQDPMQLHRLDAGPDQTRKLPKPKPLSTELKEIVMVYP